MFYLQYFLLFALTTAKIDDEEERCNVTVVINGVKRPKFFGLFGKNTEVDLQLKEQCVSLSLISHSLLVCRSLRLFCEVTVKRQGKNKLEKCLYQVNRLPNKIDVDASSYTVKEGQVLITLVKLEPGSWANILDQYGLETAPGATASP